MIGRYIPRLDYNMKSQSAAKYFICAIIEGYITSIVLYSETPVTIDYEMLRNRPKHDDFLHTRATAPALNDAVVA